MLQGILHQGYKLRRALVATSYRCMTEASIWVMASRLLERVMDRCVMLEFAT